jgi:hypothetical protein
MKTKYNNLEMIVHVARKLDNLLEKVVFLGESATGLLITDPVAPDVSMAGINVILNLRRTTIRGFMISSLE